MVLKVSFPHFEEQHEIQGLRLWAGDPTVRLLAADEEKHVMLLERCIPGSSLKEVSEKQQDVVIAGLLRRMWRCPPEPSQSIRTLGTMLAYWRAEAESRLECASDPALVRDGIGLLCAMASSAANNVLLATDLHAGNVLRSSREPWLVIDPKPFVGDPPYDATQHLLNCTERLLANPEDTIERFADLLEVRAERVALWLFGRVAVASGDPDKIEASRALHLARRLRAIAAL